RAEGNVRAHGYGQDRLTAGRSGRRRRLEGDAAVVFEIAVDLRHVLAGLVHVSGESPHRFDARDVQVDLPVGDLAVEAAEPVERVLERGRRLLVELFDQICEPPVPGPEVRDAERLDVDVLEVLDLALQPLPGRAERRLRACATRDAADDLIRQD